MKLLPASFCSLLLLTPVVAQKLPEWQRAYTFDESVIEINTANVIIGGDIGRVTFRWIFDQPQPMKDNPKSAYKSRLETMEFKCADSRYRMYELTFLDASGKTIHSELMSPPYEWRPIRGEVMKTLARNACDLINERVRILEGQPSQTDEEIELQKVVRVARSIKDTLERSRDLKPIIKQFFAVDFVTNYLSDTDTNWFYNLNRDVASKATRDQIQQFYVAHLNAGYLIALYVINQSWPDSESSDEPVSAREKIPDDVYQLIDRHPYTRTYGAKKGSYDFLAENIDSIPRMLSYTSLLEEIAGLMRKHLARVPVARSNQDPDTLEDSFIKSQVSSAGYLGLPKGSRLYELNLAVLRLQLAEINGEVKVVSATDTSH